MPNDVRNQVPEDQVDQEIAENPAELFTEDDAFYTTDARSDEQIAQDEERRRNERRSESYVPGFFDDEEVLARVDRIDAEVMVPGMLKSTATARLMDDLRTYYLGKGECTYTTREPATDENGTPVFQENGERATREVIHTVPVTTYDEMMDLNNLPMEARRQIVDHYLTDLEAHPIGNSVDEATAEANARYFARIHKAAMERNGRSPWPAVDLNARGAIEDLAAGRSPIGVRATYAVDFSQNNENLVNSNPRDEKKWPNRVRMAYFDEFGGTEEYAKQKDLQDLAQGMKNLATVITAPQAVGLSLRQRALAKAFIEYYNGVLQEVNQFGTERYRQGSALEAQAAFGYFFTPDLNLPDAGAPTDEQVRAYLNGESASPFSEAYIGEVRKGILEKRVADAQAETQNHASLLEDIDTRMIYNLSYVQMPHKVPDAQGQMVDAPQSLPDPYAMTPEVKHETEQIFDQTLGHLTGLRNYGLQAYYASQLGRRTIDCFRIGGQKASEYLAAHGYPQLAQDLGQKDAETAQKAAILSALADLNLEVTFVPLVMGRNGVPVEAAPIRITPATALFIPSPRETASIPTALPDDEASKYYAAMDQYSVNMTAVLACDPGRDVIGMQSDEHLKEAIRSESIHTGGKHLDMVPRTIMERLFYDIDGKNGEPPFDDYGHMRNYMGSGKADEAVGHALLVGTQKDGTLNRDGKQNLASLKSFMHTMRNWTDRLADSYEKKSPLLAEYLRAYTDELRTVEDGSTWFDNVHDTTYMIVRNQMAGLGAPRGPQINASSPQFMEDMLKAVTGYPTGDPSFPLPQAITAARRQVLMAAESKRAAREGTLTLRHERQSRRMMLSELDILEKHLRTIDRLAEKSRIIDSPEADFCEMLEDNSKHRQYLDNSASDASSYYPRGMKRAWSDMEGKRALLANGWPLEDLNLLSNLYWRRTILRDDVERDRAKNTPEWAQSKERSIKVLDQILGELERTPIRNAEDRKRMLQMIDGYGDHFYNTDVFSTEPNIKDQLRKEIRAAIDRQPSELEFLSEAELAEAKEAYRRFQERKNGPDPDAPTVNGPRTEVEHAFLNVERLGLLYTMQGRLSADRTFSRDPLHSETLTQLDSFLTQVENFYANADYLKPEQQAARDAAFTKIVQDSAALSTQIGKSIDQLTNNGRKERFNQTESKQLESLKTMQDQVRHMRSLHAAQIDFEIRKREDLARYQQAQQEKLEKERQLREDVARIKVVDNEDGTFYVDRDYLVSQLSDEALGYLSEAHPNGLPDMFLVQNFDGHLMPEEVHRRLVEDRERMVAELREQKQKQRQAVIEERAKRREEIKAEDLTGAAADLFAAEDRRLEEERRAETEPVKRQLIKELRAIAREEETATEAFRQRIEAIAADESLSWDMRRIRIEEEEERFNEQRAAEGTGWESRRARLGERLRQLDERAADQQFTATRRQQEALDTGDERYTWSFRHILQDVCDRKDAAEQAFAEAKNNPDSTVHDVTQKGIRAYEESERYKQMMNLVGASFETEKLQAALQKKWPDWVAQQLMPNLEGTTDPKMRHSRMILAMRTMLPAAEVHAFLDELTATLREDLKDDLRRRLLTVQNKTELAYEDQVVRPLHERVEELKRQRLFDSAGHLLNEKGVPYPPDSQRDGKLLDDHGIPYPDDSDEQKEYQRQVALSEALDYADRVITVADVSVRGAYQHRHDIHEEAYEAQKKRDSDEIIAGKERDYRNVLNALLTDGQAFVTNGVEPWQEDYREYIINSGYRISPEHNDKITQLLTQMEEMHLPVSDDVPGGTGENRAFSNLIAAQDALSQAVQDGDAQKILEAKQNLEQARRDIETLYAYVKDEANFPAESVPGNTDATRSASVPLEYSKDTFASSKLNGIHTLYSALKWADISVQEFHEDPSGTIRRLYEKSMEPLDPDIQLEDKTFGEILGGFAAETNDDRTKRIAQTKTIQEVVRRGVEAIVNMDRSEEARKLNQLTARLHEQYNANVLDHRLRHTNPFTDPERKAQVQQLLSIVEEDNLEADRPKMLMSKPLDARGRRVETITAENYVDSLGPDFDRYLNLVTRGEELLTDAVRTGGANFNPVEFMENRQKALSMMLVRRVADRNKSGYNLLEDEVVNTAEYYESIRLAHPELSIPALTAEQKKLFDTRGKQLKQQLKRAENALSRDQKRQIADRGAELRGLLAGMRKGTDHRDRVTAELEQRNIVLFVRPQPIQAAPTGDRISNEDAAARLNRQQDAARQRQEAREQEQRNRLLAEQKRNARDARLKEKLELPLAKRMEDVFQEHFWSRYTVNEMAKQGLDKSRPEVHYDATLNANDAQRRVNEILAAVTGDLTKESFANLLTETLGAEKGSELLTKLGGNVPQIYSVQRLTADERMVLFAALAGNLSTERRSEVLWADDSFVTVRGMDTTSTITFDSKGPEKTVFERQVDHPANDRVNGLLKQAGLDWKGMTDGKGTQEELDAFRRDLADANALFTRVKPGIQDRQVDRMGADFRMFNAREALILEEGKKKPENAYLLDLFTTEKGVTVVKENRQQDARETSKTNPGFAPEYVAGLAKIMRKMEEFGVIQTGLNAEEGGKVYAFHQVYEARHQLDLALQADMTVEENRKKLSQAVREMKEAQSRTDELMRMAKDVFSKSDYMDNLDSTRAPGVPWQYARDIVTSSQLSGAYMFANYLKENNISVDEFERHPDQVIERLKSSAQEGITSLSNITKGRSMGEILVCGATNYFDGLLQNARTKQLGKYTRGIDALIEADPGDDSPRKERNRFIYRQNVMNYMENIANGARNNATLLKEGFLGKSHEGFEAIKIMSVIPEEDFDPDTMITKVPMNADGSRRKLFHLGNYLMDKGDIDYQAQVGRLEKMIADAKAAEARFIREETEQDLLGGIVRYPGVVGGAFRRNLFQVPMLLQARQQALIEMLTLHPENAKEPGYAQLEDEVLHMTERYEALCKAQPELNLPALSKVWKKALETQKKNYLDLKNNRTKLMNKAEETIRKGVKAEEKRFNSQMKTTAERIRKLNERIARRDAKIAQADDKIHQAALGDNEKKGLAAYEEKVALLREKRELEEERQKLEQSLNALRIDRMKTLTAQYRDGKLPYPYVRARLQQIDEGREQEALPGIFGDYRNNEEEKEIRDRFLGGRILSDHGANVNRKPEVIDHPMNWMVWNNRFWTEAEAAEQSQAAQELDLTEGAYEEEFVIDEPLESEQTEPTRNIQEPKPPVQQAEPPREETVQPRQEQPKPPVQPVEPPKQEKKPVQPVQPKQEPKPPVQQAEQPKQAKEQEQRLIEELKKYPPKRRDPGVHAPVRNRMTGEILIRSHDIDPKEKKIDPGDETLPRAILNCGDAAVLRQYKKMYGDKIKSLPDGQMYIEYLDQRIAGLSRIDQVMKECGRRTESGKGPVTPPVTTFLDGTVMLANFHQEDFQTSPQGCWSVALSNLLKSRGVNLTQKDVRAFRTTKTLQQGENTRALETNEFNNEAGSDPFHDSELVMRTAPNTAMHTWGFEDLPPARIENGAIYRDEADDTAVEAIREQVKYALQHDHSPVAIKYCGHYRTIVGIKGNTLLFKDSRQPDNAEIRNGVVPDPDRTHSIDLYEVVKETRTQPAGYQRDLSLVWLSELHKDKVTGGVEELKNYPDLRVDKEGKVTLSQEMDPTVLYLEGHADTECARTSAQEKHGLRPYYWTKFPNKIRKNLLKDAKEPSRSIDEHLTLPDAQPSPQTGQIVDHLLVAPSGGIGAFDAELMNSFWQQDENRGLFTLLSDVCFDAKGNLVPIVQEMADEAYQVSDTVSGHTFAQHLVVAIQSIPEAERSEAQNTALGLAMDRMEAWKPQQVRDISIDDVYRKAYGSTPVSGSTTKHQRQTPPTTGPNLQNDRQNQTGLGKK